MMQDSRDRAGRKKKIGKDKLAVATARATDASPIRI